jgi:hypothetical protein
MEGIRTIDDLIKAKGLTAKEEESLREIIEECKLRESQIKVASEQAKHNLEGLSKTFTYLVDGIFNVSQAVSDLHAEVERMQLRIMPEEQFFRE